MEKRLSYLNLSTFLKEKFGEKVKKIPLDAGFTCPNRDGTKGYGGCIYCDNKGSGTGFFSKFSLKEQIEFFLTHFKSKGYKKFIAYFQAFSNTYGESELLRKKYALILSYPEIVGLAIGTRPDCIDREKIKVLKEFQELSYELWVELGLQSKHDRTLELINRGHSFEEFLKAYFLLKEAGIPVVVHIIFGLPQETKEMMSETVKTLAELKVDGIKFHCLYVLEGTPLGEIYKRGEYKPLTLEEYVDLVVESLNWLPENTVIHRLTSDPPKEKLLAPTWLLNKNQVLKEIQKRLESNLTK